MTSILWALKKNNQHLFLNSDSTIESCMVTANQWHGSVLEGLVVYWRTLKSSEILTQMYQHWMTSDMLKLNTESDDRVKVWKVKGDLMEREDLDQSLEKNEWGSRQNLLMIMGVWKSGGWRAWGEEVKPVACTHCQTFKHCLAGPVAEIVDSLGHRRKCLSGFQIFSGLLLRITIFGLGKLVTYDVSQEI